MAWGSLAIYLLYSLLQLDDDQRDEKYTQVIMNNHFLPDRLNFLCLDFI